MNKEILKTYGNLNSIPKDILNNNKINSVSFYPFEDIEVIRTHSFSRAYQIKKLENNKVDIYFEPHDIVPNAMVVFTKNIEDKNIIKGDKGEIITISSNNTLFKIELENGKYVTVKSDSFVYDSDYKFAHIVKVNTSGQKYYSTNSSTISGYKEESHWLKSDNPYVFCVRYKGVLNHDVAIKIRELFEKTNTGLVKLEKKGEYAFLIQDKMLNANLESPEMNIYLHPRKYYILKDSDLNKINNKKMKI